MQQASVVKDRRKGRVHAGNRSLPSKSRNIPIDRGLFIRLVFSLSFFQRMFGRPPHTYGLFVEEHHRRLRCGTHRLPTPSAAPVANAGGSAGGETEAAYRSTAASTLLRLGVKSLSKFVVCCAFRGRGLKGGAGLTE